MPDLRRDYVFLLAGFGSEYALQPLERFLEQHGYCVVGADMQTGPLPLLPERRKPILLTSQHPSCSSAVFRVHWGQHPPYANYISPFEIIANLRPACTVFVPHDLEASVRPDEIAYMMAFDIYCSPYAEVNPVLHRMCKVLPTGWIKHNSFDVIPEAIKALTSDRGVFFLNQIVSLMRSGGAPYIQTNYPAIFADGPPLKLPVWPGCDEMASHLQQLGATVLDSHLPATALIAASPRIYVNAPGSVVAESRYVGTEAILAGKREEPDMQLSPGDVNAKAAHFDFGGLLAAIAAHVGKHP